MLGFVPPGNVACPAFLFLTIVNIENWEISSRETLTGRTVRLILPLYIRDSLFDVRASDLSV